MEWRSKIVGHDKVRADQLLANPFNHRMHPTKQRELVEASIAELGFVKSVLVNKRTGHIVDGHERAMQALGVGEDTMVDVEYVDLSPEDEKKALLLLDASSELAEVDARALEDLASMCAFDNDLLNGFAETMLADVGKGHKTGIEDDDVPVAADPRTKRGDMWILGGHRVLCGDSENKADVARLLHGVDCQLMVTDPPYGVEYDPSWRSDAGLGNTERTGVVLNDHKADWTEAWRLFPGSVCYVWHGGLHASVVQASLEKVGFEIRSQIIWAKPRIAISRGAYHWQHEPAFVAGRGEVSIEPDDDLEAEHAWYAVRKGAKSYWCGGRKRSTVWQIDFAGEVKSRHGTQKPVACMARAMQNHGKPGDTVYDPFLGSGTSIIAAERTKRFCCGMELDPNYVDLIVARWEALTGQKAVLAS